MYNICYLQLRHFISLFQMQENTNLQRQKQQTFQNQKPHRQPIKENCQSVQSSNKSQESIRKELLSMQFQAHLVDKALLITNDLERAVEYIISLLEAQDIQEISTQDTIELVLLIRMDLKMGMGKIAAQCAHCVLKGFQIARDLASNDDKYLPVFIKWLQSGKQKVFYKVQTEQELTGLLKQFKQMGASTCYIKDAGRTQIAAGSLTVGGIGPFSSKTMHNITKKLKRL